MMIMMKCNDRPLDHSKLRKKTHFQETALADHVQRHDEMTIG